MTPRRSSSASGWIGSVASFREDSLGVLIRDWVVEPILHVPRGSYQGVERLASTVQLEERNIAKKKGQQTAAPFRNHEEANVDLVQTLHEIRLGSVCPVV
jgi:hypothetical protein